MQVFSRIQRVFSWLSRPEKYRNLFARKGEKIPTSMLLFSTLTQRERVNHLPHLTPEKAGQLYEAYLRGELAEVQMVWKQMEDFDSTLGTVLHARQSALAEMTWRIETDDDLTAGSDELAALAAKQKAYLNALLRGVDNLEEALVHLGMADFRGVAAVELTGDRQRQVWSVIEPWNLTKPVLHGPWLYNAMADTVCPHPEELDEERVIIREARALDLAAMFLVLSKVHALQGWDGFLDIYGLPSVFAELPASIPEDQALEFDLVVKRMVGDGRGTVPNGTKFQTVETTKDNAQAFEQRAKWCDEAIIKLGLGGLLTVETQAGSGTLAGNAHADSFERLCAASARSISRAVDTQYCRRLLRAKFGSHTPILVHFVFGPQETEDRAAIATMLATLATAGYRAEDTVASDLLGIEITSANMDSTAIYAAKAAGYVPTQAAMQQRMGMPLKPAPAAEGSGVASPPMVANRAAAEGSGVASRAPEPQPDSAPLSAEELEAITALAKGGLNQEQIAHDAEAAADALAQAVQPARNAVANSEKAGEIQDITELLKEEEKELNDGDAVENRDNPCRAKNPATCPYHGGFEHPFVGKTGTAESIGLPKLSSAEVKAEPSLPRRKSKLADALMRGGIQVQTVDGETITFDKEVPDHWLGKDGSKPKPGKERDKRFSRLADALRVTVFPHEIWQHHDKKVYVRKYRKPNGDSFVMVGVVKQNGKARTYYWDAPDEVEKARQGKLIYCRTK